MNRSTLCFDGLKAWFSDSVANKYRRAWEDNGGYKAEKIEDAQFLFSQSSTASDTIKIYECDAAVEQHVAVIHASYIVAVLHAGDPRAVPLGDFFLPHPALLEVLHKDQISFKWEKDEPEITTASPSTSSVEYVTAESSVN